MIVHPCIYRDRFGWVVLAEAARYEVLFGTWPDEPGAPCVSVFASDADLIEMSLCPGVNGHPCRREAYVPAYPGGRCPICERDYDARPAEDLYRSPARYPAGQAGRW